MVQLSIGNLVLGNKPVIKSVQHGMVTINDGQTVGTKTITSVDTNNAFVVYGIHVTASAVIDDNLCRVQLTNATTVKATRIGTSETNNVYFQVIEYYPGIIKSKQLVSRAGLGNVTINAVNVSKTICFFQGYTSTETDIGEQVNNIVLLNSTTVSFKAAAYIGGTFYGIVVEFY